jgi:hypothetical protein
MFQEKTPESFITYPGLYCVVIQNYSLVQIAAHPPPGAMLIDIF